MSTGEGAGERAVSPFPCLFFYWSREHWGKPATTFPHHALADQRYTLNI